MAGHIETLHERDVVSDTGKRWRVREAAAHEVPGAPTKSCLIFDGVTVCRRLWAYPSRWAELTDAALLELMNHLRTAE
jgi:hypothetical protein